MLPVLARIGPLTLYSYGAMMALAFVAGLLVARWVLRRRGVDAYHALDLVLAAAIGGLVGARILYVVSDWGSFAAHPIRIFEVWRGGMVFYGGAIGGAIAVTGLALLRHLRLGDVADAAAVALPLGSALGRIGCFLNGCCYGAQTSSALGCRFPGIGGRVLPTQLFDSASNLAIAGIALFMVARRGDRPGLAWWTYLALYGVSRFTVEFWRVNPRGLLGLSQAQLISIPVFIAGVAGIAWTLARPRAATRAESDGETSR